MTQTYYTYIPRSHTASSYYRLQVPFYTARDLGLPCRLVIDTNDSGITTEQRVHAFCEADFVILYHPISDSTLHNCRIAKSFIPSLRDGDWKYPPTLVVETDDNLFHVSPYNMSFKGLGYRDPEGNDLPKGHLIGDVQDGKRRVLWKDGEDGFDIARNKQTIDSYRQILNVSDLVSCSVPYLASEVKEESLTRRAEVFPNLIRFDHYEQVRLVPESGRINILWQGGASHYEDWFPLKDALGRITKKYPQVHWKIWGQMYHWVTELIPPDRFTFVNWCPYPEYKLRLAMINHDINLAPLSDSRFNRCRSAIKWYEASVLERDIPTLAQRTGPYKTEIQDGETGLLFETPKEFEAQLSRLIEDAKLRQIVGENAKDWVHENRDAMKKVPGYFARLDEIRETTKRECPHMPEESWAAFEEDCRKQQEAETLSTQPAEA